MMAPPENTVYLKNFSIKKISPAIPDNRAEQQFRYLIILRGITYGSKSEEGCRTLALLASVTDTLNLLKQEGTVFLAQVFDAMRKGFTPPPMPFPTHPPP